MGLPFIFKLVLWKRIGEKRTWRKKSRQKAIVSVIVVLILGLIGFCLLLIGLVFSCKLFSTMWSNQDTRMKTRFCEIERNSDMVAQCGLSALFVIKKILRSFIKLHFSFSLIWTSKMLASSLNQFLQRIELLDEFVKFSSWKFNYETCYIVWH